MKSFEIFKKRYEGFESLCDLGRDIHEVFDVRFNPVMKNIDPEFEGTMEVTIKYVEHDDIGGLGNGE